MNPFTYLVFADNCMPLGGQSRAGEMVKQDAQDQHTLGGDRHSMLIAIHQFLSPSLAKRFELGFKFNEDGQEFIRNRTS